MKHKVNWAFQVLLTGYFIYSSIDNGLHHDWQHLAIAIAAIPFVALAFAYFRYIEDMVN